MKKLYLVWMWNNVILSSDLYGIFDNEKSANELVDRIKNTNEYVERGHVVKIEVQCLNTVDEDLFEYYLSD